MAVSNKPTYSSKMCKKLGDRCPQVFCPFTMYAFKEKCQMKESLYYITEKQILPITQRSIRQAKCSQEVFDLVVANPGITSIELSGILNKGQEAINSFLIKLYKKGALRREFKESGRKRYYEWFLTDNQS